MVIKSFKFLTREDSSAAVDPSTGKKPQRKPTLKEIAIMISDVNDYAKVQTFTDNDGNNFVEIHISDDRLVLNKVSAECADFYEDKILSWLADKHQWILGKLVAEGYVLIY